MSGPSKANLIHFNTCLFLSYNAISFLVFTYLFFKYITYEQRFQFTIWLVIYIEVLIDLTYSLLRLLTTLSLITQVLFLITGGFLILLSHWLFCWQYYTSAIDVQTMLQTSVVTGEQEARNKSCQRKVNILVLTLISVSSLSVLGFAFYVDNYSTLAEIEQRVVLLIEIDGLQGFLFNTFSIVVLTIAVVTLKRIIAQNPMLKQAHAMMRLHFVFIATS